MPHSVTKDDEEFAAAFDGFLDADGEDTAAHAGEGAAAGNQNATTTADAERLLARNSISHNRVASKDSSIRLLHPPARRIGPNGPLLVQSLLPPDTHRRPFEDGRPRGRPRAASRTASRTASSCFEDGVELPRGRPRGRSGDAHVQGRTASRTDRLECGPPRDQTDRCVEGALDAGLEDG